MMALLLRLLPGGKRVDARPPSRRWFAAAFLALVLLVPFGGSAMAVVPQLSVDQACDRATLVLIGVVSDTEAFDTPDEDTIVHTRATITVERAIRGSAPAEVELTLPYGRTATATANSGQTQRLVRGARYLFFLWTRSDGTIDLLHGYRRGGIALDPDVDLLPEPVLQSFYAGVCGGANDPGGRSVAWDCAGECAACLDPPDCTVTLPVAGNPGEGEVQVFPQVCATEADATTAAALCAEFLSTGIECHYAVESCDIEPPDTGVQGTLSEPPGACTLDAGFPLEQAAMVCDPDVDGSFIEDPPLIKGTFPALDLTTLVVDPSLSTVTVSLGTNSVSVPVQGTMQLYEDPFVLRHVRLVAPEVELLLDTYRDVTLRMLRESVGTMDEAGSFSAPLTNDEGDETDFRVSMVQDGPGVLQDESAMLGTVLLGGTITGRIDFDAGTWEASFTQSSGGVGATASLAGTIANRPPVSDFRVGSTGTCDVELDGTLSTDPDGSSHVTTHVWALDDVTAGEGDTLVVNAAPGTHTVAMQAIDRFGTTSAAPVSGTIEVTDATAPSVAPTVKLPGSTEATASACLWPPNKKLVRLDLGDELLANADDDCDGADVGVEIAGVSVTEEGATTDGGSDVVVADDFVCLRADRTGGGDGRTYTIAIEATDAAGNAVTATAEVVVTHDMGHGVRSECENVPEEAFVEDGDPACTLDEDGSSAGTVAAMGGCGSGCAATPDVRAGGLGALALTALAPAIRRRPRKRLGRASG